MERHSHSIMNIGYILSGELTITTDNGATKTFKAGDTPIEVVDTIHFGENKGDEELVFIAVSLYYER